MIPEIRQLLVELRYAITELKRGRYDRQLHVALLTSQTISAHKSTRYMGHIVSIFSDRYENFG